MKHGQPHIVGSAVFDDGEAEPGPGTCLTADVRVVEVLMCTLTTLHHNGIRLRGNSLRLCVCLCVFRGGVNPHYFSHSSIHPSYPQLAGSDK